MCTADHMGEHLERVFGCFESFVVEQHFCGSPMNLDEPAGLPRVVVVLFVLSESLARWHEKARENLVGCRMMCSFGS